jgi:DNA-binding SARP family transcriptional activator/tetratricopeptide (TPR) repeat protein
VEFRVLGPVELWAAGKQCDLGSAKERCLLAVLLLAACRPVPAETLIDRVWGDRPPAEVWQSLRANVSRLRAALESAGVGEEVQLRGKSHTYTLEVDPEKVDFHRSRSLHVQAASILESGDRREAARLLYEADSLWRSEPLAGLTGDWVERMRVSMDGDYRAMVMELVDIELNLGRHTELIGFLLSLVNQYPLYEDIVAQLMLAYYRCGRQADALALFTTTKERLSAEIGVDPGPRLQELHGGILTHDSSLRFVRQGRTPRAARLDGLPASIPEFTGRVAEIEALTGTAGPRCGVITIAGMPGVGKTSLAIKAAHGLVDDFPDAQLYIDLRAHDAQRPPTEPAAALSALLQALGVPPMKIPQSLAEQSRLWRGELVGRRVLIVLDDAADSGQVRPLLPDTPDCQVIITSRCSLDGLPGASRHQLKVLSIDDAVSLFTRIADPDSRLAAAEVIEVIRLCGGLPLAIRLAAIRIRDHQVSSIGELKEQLRDARENMEGGQNTELTAAFALSYRDLDQRQRRVFRSLGLSPVREFRASNVAPLADMSISDTERALAELVDQNLLFKVASQRFRCHELIRHFAYSFSLREDSEKDRRRAVGRVLDHYLEKARSADRMLYPYGGASLGPKSAERSGPPAFETADEARDWMADEWRNLSYLVHYCAGHERNSHVIDLTEAIARFFDTAGHWEEARRIQQRALKAGQELEIKPAVAQARLNLAVIHWRTGHTRRAFQDARLARDLYRQTLDSVHEAAALDRMGLILWASSDYRAALAFFGEAGDIYREIGDKHGEADCLGHIGMGLLHTGRYLEAIDAFEEALRIFSRLNYSRGKANVLNNLGDAKLRLGYYREAVDLYNQCQEIYNSITGIRNTGILLINFGDVARYRGRTRAALELYRKALAGFAETGDRLNECNVLNNIGLTLTDDERFDEALGHHRRALSIARDIENVFEETRAILGTANAQIGVGRCAPAQSDYLTARGLARDIGDPYLEALALSGIAKAVQLTEGPDAARIYLRQARDLFGQLGDLPELAWVQVRLQALEFASSKRRRRRLAGRTGENPIV